MSRVVALFIGTPAGFLMAWAGLTNPIVIRDMLLLREPHVFLLMGSAIVVAGIGARLLRSGHRQSLVTGEPIGWTPTRIERRHFTGSVLFGAGWSVACTCPGPVTAMIGQGHVAGLAVGAGIVAGVVLKHRVDHRSKAFASIETPLAAGL